MLFLLLNISFANCFSAIFNGLARTITNIEIAYMQNRSILTWVREILTLKKYNIKYIIERILKPIGTEASALPANSGAGSPKKAYPLAHL